MIRLIRGALAALTLMLPGTGYAEHDVTNMDDFLDPRLRGSNLCFIDRKSRTDDDSEKASGSKEKPCEARKGETLHVLDVSAGHVNNYLSMHQITNMDSSFATVSSRHYLDLMGTSEPPIVLPLQIVGSYTTFFNEDGNDEIQNRAELRLGQYSFFGDDESIQPARVQMSFTYEDLRDDEWRYEVALDTKLDLLNNIGEVTFSYYKESEDFSEFRFHSYSMWECKPKWCSGKNARSYGGIGWGLGYGEGDFRWLPFSAVVGFEYTLKEYLTVFANYSYAYQTDTDNFREGSNNQLSIGFYLARFY